MMKPPLPPNEVARLDNLHQYDILDTPSEAAFDDLSHLAAQICGAPIAMISLVDSTRQWFKSKIGLDVSETPRDLSICAHAILQADVLVVEDIQQDHRFFDNPSVTSAPNIQFYAGAPLVTVEGYAIGTLCVLDQVPRQLQPAQVEAIQALARQVVTQLELRRNLTDFKRALEQRQQVEQALRESEDRYRQQAIQLQQALDFEAMLKRITDKVRDSLDKNQILQTAIEELALVLGMNSCNAALYELKQGTSTICYEYTTALSVSQGRVAQMADSPEIYRQLLQGQYFQFCSILPSSARGQTASLACPILDDQGVLGDLWLINHQDYVFKPLEIRLVQQVANQCAIAIRQARLYQASQAQVEELEKLNRLKDDFLSTVSHELRTPMSNIKLAIHMLKLDMLGSPGSKQERNSRQPTHVARRQHYLNILQAECARETELINNLLDLQRLEAAAYPISLALIHLDDWLVATLEPFQLRISERQQVLEVESPTTSIISGPENLGRILAELMNNACKYTPAGGKIALRVTHGPGSPRAVTTFILSNETEIPPAELPRIFEKFYRVPTADPWKQGGTGLGLTLVKKLVEQLQGSIQVTSGRGKTIFTIQLPQQVLEEDCAG